jgi:protein phosphatase 1 regulatory subunit 7
MKSSERDLRRFEVVEWAGRRTLWLDSDRVEECLAAYRRHNLDWIGISPYQGRPHGYRSGDVGFLRQHPYVKGVALPYASRIDISPLKSLRELAYLHIAENRQPLDLSRFPKLEELRAEWHAGLQLPEHSKALRTLALWKYKPSSKDLTELPELARLEELVMVQSPLTSIDGVERYRTLKRLELSYLTRLERIGAVAGLADCGLEELDCLKCRRIQDHSAVRVLRSLKILRFNSCGEIPSIRFLDDMPSLDDFRFVNTNVVDGDLRPCLRLKGVGFTRKKHFSHTPREVRKIIGART